MEMLFVFQITSENIVCQACWDLAQKVVLGRRAINAPAQIEYPSICLRCGRSHTVSNDSAHESGIYNVTREWILPRTVILFNITYILFYSNCNEII